MIEVSMRCVFDTLESTGKIQINSESNKGLSNEVAKFLVSDENLIIKNQTTELEVA